MPQRRERRGEAKGREGRGKERKEDSHTARKKERDKQTNKRGMPRILAWEQG